MVNRDKRGKDPKSKMEDSERNTCRKKKKMKVAVKKKTGDADIPIDVLADILSRLPAKFVWSLRFICKDWQYLIQSPSFADLQLSRSKERCLMVGFYSCTYYITTFYSIDKEDGNAVQVGQAEIVNPNKHTASSSCVNGLVCYIGTDKHIKVCNPVTHELVTLPNPTFSLSCNPFIEIGFDSSSNRYKVLAVKGRNLSEVEIFTLGATESNWRKVQVPSSVVEINRMPDRIYVNGCVYWLTSEFYERSENGDMKHALIAFNFAQEKFEYIPAPPHIHFDTLSDDYWIGELEGCFCLVEHMEVDGNIYGGRKKVRLMKLTNSSTQPWVHQYITLPQSLNDISSVFHISSGVMLVEKDFLKKYICHYNEEGQVVKSIKVHGIPYDFQPKQLHSETLVSLKSI